MNRKILVIGAGFIGMGPVLAAQQANQVVIVEQLPREQNQPTRSIPFRSAAPLPEPIILVRPKDPEYFDDRSTRAKRREQDRRSRPKFKRR